VLGRCDDISPLKQQQFFPVIWYWDRGWPCRGYIYWKVVP